MDPASAAWAADTNAVPAPTDNGADPTDVIDNVGEPDTMRDKVYDAAAPDPGDDDGDQWGQRYEGAAVRKKAGKEDKNNGAGPVAVEVTDQPIDVVPKAPTDWAAVNFQANTVPAGVLGRQKSRRLVTLTNNGTVTVYLAPSPDVLTTPTNGFPLAAGGSIDLVTQGPVFAVASAAAQLNGVVTYDVGD